MSILALAAAAGGVTRALGMRSANAEEALFGSQPVRDRDAVPVQHEQSDTDEGGHCTAIGRSGSVSREGTA